MILRDYAIPAPLTKPLVIAHVSDLHDRAPRAVLAALRERRPDLIAVTGDLFLCLSCARYALPFLREAAAIAPTFYSPGNHDLPQPEDRRALEATGAVVLWNEYVSFGEVTVGGLQSGFGRERQGNLKRTPPPDAAFLHRFAAASGVKLLLCHHPEYWKPFIRPLPIDLTLSGHAHGGQWRIGKQGIFAPGQGFFPRYTGGVYEERLEVSRGLANTAPIPRFGNPTELPFIRWG